MSFPLRFGPCWLDSVLASGQSSLLFRAHPATESDEIADHTLVVKIPYLYLQRSSGFRQMFHERMTALADLTHPGLVPVEVTGRSGGLVWTASPQVEGWDGGSLLGAIQQSGSRPTPRQVLSLGLRLATALESLHQISTENGPLVHGELRPAKLLFLVSGEPRLLVASTVTAAAGERSSASSADRFAWRAPEQLLRQPETPRTDVRGLALLLFVLLTGSNPFQRRTTARTCSAILQDQVLFEGDAQLSGELSALLRASMSSDPERRPANMGALRDALWAELSRLGGPESWIPWVTGLRTAWPFSDDETRQNPERDALLARLVRDAPRAVEAAEPARAEPAPPPPEPAPVAQAPVAQAPVAPPPAPPEPDHTIDAEPTVLVGRHNQRHAETSGFTLVPEDVAPANPVQTRIDKLLRRALPPEEEDARTAEAPAETTQEWLPEPTSEWTAESSYEVTAERTSERTEDLPAPERRARRQARMFGAGAEVDSSFVLVTDEPTAGAGVMVATDAAGQKESLPDRLAWPPPPSELIEPDDDFIPALSEEECLAEMAREQAIREDEEADEELEENLTPIGEELPAAPHPPAVVQISRRDPDDRAVRAQAALPPLPPTTGPVHTLPTLVNQPSPTRAEPAAPVTAAPVAAATVAAAPVTAEPPAEPPRPPPEVTKPPPPAPKPPEKAATPAPPPPKKPEPPPLPRPVDAEGGRGGLYIGLALAAALLLFVGLKLGGVIGGGGEAEPPQKPPQEQSAKPEKAPEVANPPTEAVTTTEPPVTTESTPAPPEEPTPTPPTSEKPPTPEPPTSGRTTTKRADPAEQASEGPPGLTALKADAGTETSINIRGTMRGAFGRPETTLVPGAGTNGGDQYVLTFQGVESQMKITRLNVNSPLVSSVQIMSAPNTLTLLVNVSAGSKVSGYDVLPSGTGFRIRVSRPAGG